ncbi:MAG TPA: prepilin-type N-terminal cleavage/methylation domain-containing protein, partial [Aquificae bacterium]|nr:prepilin-type N-terminal cleavage/methylation domain-containing protein [Aquificota bacterium]
MRKQKIFKRAFTLLEILIVLLIIGLIAALVAPKILKRGEEAK